MHILINMSMENVEAVVIGEARVGGEIRLRY
jgi:hypothetical protein